MLDLLSAILAANSLSYAIVAGLTVFAAVAVKAMTSSTAFAVGFAPGLAFGGLAGIYGFREAAIFPTSDPSSNVLIAAAAGLIAGLAVMLLATRLVYLVTEIRKPVRRAAR
jgi:hypothetical protein